MEQSVRPNETHCSTRRNKPFCVLKQAVILGETKRKLSFPDFTRHFFSLNSYQFDGLI